MDSNLTKVISIEDRRHQADLYNLPPSLPDKSQDTVTTQPYVFDRPIWGDLEQLKQKVARLEQRIAELESEKSPATYIELRDISYLQVKEEIAQYFINNDGKEISQNHRRSRWLD